MKRLESFPALHVKQWRKEWDQVPWSDARQQRKPEHGFFMFAAPASTLKALTGVYRRSADKAKPVARKNDPNVQRAHDESRSSKIRDLSLIHI